jgi:hypothetical protein
MADSSGKRRVPKISDKEWEAGRTIMRDALRASIVRSLRELYEFDELSVNSGGLELTIPGTQSLRGYAPAGRALELAWVRKRHLRTRACVGTQAPPAHVYPVSSSCFRGT